MGSLVTKAVLCIGHIKIKEIQAAQHRRKKETRGRPQYLSDLPSSPWHRWTTDTSCLQPLSTEKDAAYRSMKCVASL